MLSVDLFATTTASILGLYPLRTLTHANQPDKNDCFTDRPGSSKSKLGVLWPVLRPISYLRAKLG